MPYTQIACSLRRAIRTVSYSTHPRYHAYFVFDAYFSPEKGRGSRPSAEHAFATTKPLRHASDFLAEGPSRISTADLAVDAALQLFEPKTAIWTDGHEAYVSCGADAGLMQTLVGAAAKNVGSALSAVTNGRSGTVTAFFLSVASHHLDAALEAESGVRTFRRL